MVTIPLKDFVNDEGSFNISEITNWYHLKCKDGQKKDDYRGEIEATVAFIERPGILILNEKVSFSSFEMRHIVRKNRYSAVFFCRSRMSIRYKSEFSQTNSSK